MSGKWTVKTVDLAVMLHQHICSVLSLYYRIQAKTISIGFPPPGVFLCGEWPCFSGSRGLGCLREVWMGVSWPVDAHRASVILFSLRRSGEEIFLPRCGTFQRIQSLPKVPHSQGSVMSFCPADNGLSHRPICARLSREVFDSPLVDWDHLHRILCALSLALSGLESGRT
jgi:hypothetical protein